jgi:hypothetical protein
VRTPLLIDPFGHPRPGPRRRSPAPAGRRSLGITLGINRATVGGEEPTRRTKCWSERARHAGPAATVVGRYVEGPVRATGWGFKSPLRHVGLSAKAQVRGGAVVGFRWDAPPFVITLSSLLRDVSYCLVLGTESRRCSWRRTRPMFWPTSPERSGARGASRGTARQPAIEPTPARFASRERQVTFYAARSR